MGAESNLPVDEVAAFNQYALDDVVERMERLRADPNPVLGTFLPELIMIGDVIATNVKLYAANPASVEEARRMALVVGAVGRIINEIWDREDMCVHDLQVAFGMAMQRVVATANELASNVPPSPDEG